MTQDAPTTRLDLGAWDRTPDRADQMLLDRCVGPTLDVGCGPGRLTAALAERGRVVLGIDVLPVAVGRTWERGGSALRRDVFDLVPGEGRWHTVLLADGNVGIGGDPGALLGRVRRLLDPRGRVVVELAAPGVACVDDWARLESVAGARLIRWSVVGLDAIAPLAAAAGMTVVEQVHCEGRWCAVLAEALR